MKGKSFLYSKMRKETFSGGTEKRVEDILDWVSYIKQSQYEHEPASLTADRKRMNHMAEVSQLSVFMSVQHVFGTLQLRDWWRLALGEWPRSVGPAPAPQRAGAGHRLLHLSK